MKGIKHINHTFSVVFLSWMLCLGIMGSSLHVHTLGAGPRFLSKNTGTHTIKQSSTGIESLSLFFDNSFEEIEELQEKQNNPPLWNYIYDFACYDTFLRTISQKPFPFTRHTIFTVYNIPVYILFHSWKGFTR